MTEAALDLLLGGGPVILALATFLSCLALPVPSSILMLSAGAFAASGDLNLATVVLAALAGAVLGDQAGFLLGRAGQGRIATLATRSDAARRLAADASRLIQHRGNTGVFLSRWLFSPLGPYVNFAAAGLGMDRARFTLWAALGEVVWVTLYVGLGFVLSDRLSALADILANVSGAFAAAALTAGLGFALFRLDRTRKGDGA